MWIKQCAPPPPPPAEGSVYTVLFTFHGKAMAPMKLMNRAFSLFKQMLLIFLPDTRAEMKIITNKWRPRGSSYPMFMAL